MIKSKCCNRPIINTEPEAHCSNCHRVIKIEFVCQDCGDRNNWNQFEISSWYPGKCDICEEVKTVTQYRDFFYGRYQK